MADAVDTAKNVATGAFTKVKNVLLNGTFWTSVALGTVFCVAAGAGAIAPAIAALPEATNLTGVAANVLTVGSKAATVGAPKLLTASAHSLQWGAEQMAEGATWAATHTPK